MRFIGTVLFALMLVLMTPSTLLAHGHGGRTHSGTREHRSTRTEATSSSHGRIRRSTEAPRKFEEMTGYPHGRPGYVIDHIVPLACGGADDPSNMQWQTVGEAEAKDKWERSGCARRR